MTAPVSTSVPAGELDWRNPSLWRNLTHLITEDNNPVDNPFAEKQMRLLTESRSFPTRKAARIPENWPITQTSGYPTTSFTIRATCLKKGSCASLPFGKAATNQPIRAGSSTWAWAWCSGAGNTKTSKMNGCAGATRPATSSQQERNELPPPSNGPRPPRDLPPVWPGN